MKNILSKLISGVKVFILSIVIIIMLLVFSPMLFTDEETYTTVNILYENYSSLYNGGDGLDYAIVMQCVMDTADDFINSYQNEDILKSKQYTMEYNAIKIWKDLKYNGKDKTLKKVSDIMCTFDYAPAKASSDLKMLFNSKILKTMINVKALMYNIRFDEPVLYIIFRLLSVLAVLGVIYLIIAWNDIIEPYEDEYYDDYGDEFNDEVIDYDDDQQDKDIRDCSNKEKFDEHIRARRIRMR